MSSLLGLQAVWNSYDVQMKAHRASPLTARESQAVREAAASIRSVDDLIANRKVLGYVLKAYGMDDLPYPALIRKLLSEDPGDPKSFANSFVDLRYREFAKDMGFGGGKEGSFGDPAWVDRLVARYETVTFEERKGEEDPAIRLALYFERKAPSVESWYSVLGDKALAEVAMKAMGLPQSVMLGDIDKLADTLERRMPASDFKDPAKVRTFLQRFAIMSGSEQPPAARSAALAMLQGAGTAGRSFVHIDPAMLSAAGRMRLDL